MQQLIIDRSCDCAVVLCCVVLCVDCGVGVNVWRGELKMEKYFERLKAVTKKGFGFRFQGSTSLGGRLPCTVEPMTNQGPLPLLPLLPPLFLLPKTARTRLETSCITVQMIAPLLTRRTLYTN